MQQQIAIELARRAIENVSLKRNVNNQIERTWYSDDFYIEFANLIEQYVIESNTFGFS
jgi:hypothetical protein